MSNLFVPDDGQTRITLTLDATLMWLIADLFEESGRTGFEYHDTQRLVCTELGVRRAKRDINHLYGVCRLTHVRHVPVPPTAAFGGPP